VVTIKQLQEVDHVITAFRKYVDTSDESFINGLSHEELFKTLNIFSSSRGDRESGWYKAIEMYVEKIKELERYKKTKKDRLKDLALGAILGVISTVIAGIILWYILPK
jgi:hypothetical protein